MSGPPPTPDNILEMRGSNRAGRRGAEPKPERRLPRVPTWMSKAARPLFREVCRQLLGMGILGECDRNVLSRYVVLFLRWRKAEAFLEENGSDTYVIRGKGRKQPDGSRAEGPVIAVKTFPQVRIARSLASEMLRIEDRIGLHPAGRARLAGFVNADGEGRGEAEKDRFFGTG